MTCNSFFLLFSNVSRIELFHLQQWLQQQQQQQQTAVDSASIISKCFISSYTIPTRLKREEQHLLFECLVQSLQYYQYYFTFLVSVSQEKKLACCCCCSSLTAGKCNQHDSISFYLFRDEMLLLGTMPCMLLLLGTSICLHSRITVLKRVRM